MKLYLLTLTAFGSCVHASSLCQINRRSSEDIGRGYWEEDTPPSHYTRSNPSGKKFMLKEIQNNNYHGLGAPMEMARTYAKYNKSPPPAVAAAVKSIKAVTPRKRATQGGMIGTVGAIPSNYYDSEYVVPVKIGTPPQLTYLILDTGSADLWTFTTDTDAASAVGHILYRPRQSSTKTFLAGFTWGLKYGDGSGANGIVYTDRVSIGGTFARNQAVGSAQKVSATMAADTFASGIMGMAFTPLNSVRPTKQSTYFESIQSSLALPVFTVNLQKGIPGTFNFGYIDKNEYRGSIYYSPIASGSPHWQITLSGYQVGTNAYQRSDWVSIVDTGTTLLLAPSRIVNAYYARVSGAKLDKSMGVMTFPCTATLPDFFFGLGPYRGRVPGFYMNYGPVGRGLCYGGLQTSDGLGFAIMGGILLKAQFVVFNIKAKTIGFANKQPVAQKKKAA
ncbi:aspartic peptidase domain-containing protein [Dactylonectria macrodidyma]|uniref:Aspartic peptidase domain-containing protein n=1 Tax=Dactylonectria macrodidyma TaxID=307937 RepID=A0A9P9FQP2_9HYPO|nr:aspartic peptidase domain-containing protein [Dactylonectria macrodidyma]